MRHGPPGSGSGRGGRALPPGGNAPTARRRGDDFNDDDPSLEGLDPEGPSPEDLERFGDEFRTCPECKSLVYDQAAVCQACGHAFAESPHAGIPPWALVVAVLLVLVFVAFILAGIPIP